METRENQSGAEQSPGQDLAQDQVEMTVEQLIAYFREGHGPVGAHQIVLQLDDAVAGNVDLQARLVELEGAADDAEAKIADLTAKLAAAEAKAKAAKLSQGEKAAKPRKIGPIAEGKVLPIDTLRAAIAEADKIEILFGDGKQESGPAPILVEGDAWREHAMGLMLTESVTVHGPAVGSAPYHIAGAALLLDGKQVAWCQRPEALSVGAGQKYGLSNDIFF